VFKDYKEIFEVQARHNYEVIVTKKDYDYNWLIIETALYAAILRNIIESARQNCKLAFNKC